MAEDFSATRKAQAAAHGQELNEDALENNETKKNNTKTQNAQKVVEDTINKVGG